MALRLHWPHFSGKFYLGVFGLLLALAAYLRFWAAPLSAGVDVPQFWAFAKVFQQYGLDFYRFADASLDIFPTKGWGFVYPPVWLLLLRLALVAAPVKIATETMIESSWRLAMKTPIITADLAIGCLLYWAVPGAKWRKLLFASLWLFHPTAWYNSAVFGQFDAVAAAFLLASVILLERGRDRLAFVFAGLAVMTKQHTLIPVAFMIAASARKMGWRRVVGNCAIMVGVVLAFSIPFLVTGNFAAYGRSVLLAGQAPDYQDPLMYAFSGSGSLLTYLHNVFHWEMKWLLNFNVPILVCAVLAGLWFSYKKSITPAQGALAGFLIFISLMYRVNYQYLIIYIPLALLAAAKAKFTSERVMALVIAMLPAAWIWLFRVTFWFDLMYPRSIDGIKILEKFHLTYLAPDYPFVILATVLMGLFIAHIACTFVRWRQPVNKRYST
jgi:uncharacterized membrane protein